MKPTDISVPDYFHKVVDCQWACPAHRPVPEYIRLIAAGRYGDAYMINWESNVFPGVLGRTCDRPCEPACRRGRVENEPVAICRLKRVAADFKDDIRARLPKPFPILLDSGIRSGSDMFKALALGADAVLLGRPYAYGLAIDRHRGVREAILNLLNDFELTARLSGCRNLKEITGEMVTVKF